jgi:hypothetical protein
MYSKESQSIIETRNALCPNGSFSIYDMWEKEILLFRMIS